jgi:hypothetical protein
MSKTLWDHHLEVIALLKKRGEKVLMPKHRKPMGGTPYIYIKTIPFPSKEFCVGSGFQAKDGTYELLGDHLTWYIPKLSIEELGLCDSAIGTENYDLLHPVIKYKVCPYCHGEGKVPE